MVEGGAKVIAAFLAARLVDRLVVTIAPLLMAGYNPFAQGGARLAASLPCRLAESRTEMLGQDIVLSGRPVWDPGDGE
jgi:3,4-dihydroxy 2-butanone 4-phosphate synthase/GTP cyclohydrolase II